MDKQFTPSDIINSKDVYLLDCDVIFVIDNDDKPYGFYKGSNSWFYKENFWDYFDSDLMMASFIDITKEEAAKLYLSWLDEKE